MSYEAFWIPGLDSDFDRDEGLNLGDRWLQDSAYPGTRLIVLNAALMTRNAAALAAMGAKYRVVAPQTRNHPSRQGNAVLAVWVSDRSLELAEDLAEPDGGLCLIPNTRGEGRMWIKRTRAVNLADPEAGPAEGLALDAAVMQVLDSLLTFDGHNRFHSAAGKEEAVRRLRDMIAAGHRPPPEEVEAYALQNQETDHAGAARLREIYEGTLSGHRFKDYRGRLI